MWEKTKQKLTDDQRKQVEDFYRKSDRYVRLLCFQMQLPPKITADDIYGKTYERLCVYVLSHNLFRPGYQKLAQLLTKSARSMLLVNNYNKNVIIMDQQTRDDECNSVIDENNICHNDVLDNIDKADVEYKKDKLFSCLTSNERKFLEEMYSNDLTQAEIAEKYGCTPQNVSWIIMNARKKLKKQWNTELIAR